MGLRVSVATATSLEQIKRVTRRSVSVDTRTRTLESFFSHLRVDVQHALEREQACLCHAVGGAPGALFWRSVYSVGAGMSRLAVLPRQCFCSRGLDRQIALRV